jgi:hypothetical protein
MQTTVRDTIHCTPSIEEIQITRDSIIRGLGYDTKDPGPEIVEELEIILAQLPDHCDIQCGYTLLTPDEIRIFPDRLICADIEIQTGSIIAKRLRHAEALILYVTTAGTPLDEWSHAMFAAGDHLRGYLIDSVGSEIAELTADWLELQIRNRFRERGWNASNRYSPGYCDWSVSEQQKLFSFLPDKFCGISLTESSLMIPKKSTSGIIGLGGKVKREEYQCSICDMQDCFRRRT